MTITVPQRIAGVVRTVFLAVKPDTIPKAIIWWVVSRLCVLGLAYLNGYSTQSDIRYYFSKMTLLWQGAEPATILTEYPTPVIWMLAVPYVLGTGTYAGYFYVFISIMVVLDAVFTMALWRYARGSKADPAYAIMFWTVFAIAMGEIMYMRLDMLPALLGAAAILSLTRKKQNRAAAGIAAGAALKLWPAALLPAVLVNRRKSWPAIGAFVVTGGALAFVSWIYAGWDRLVSPLIWQSGRGLQIESVWATPVMIARLVHPGSYQVHNSTYNAIEVFGPGVSQMLTVSSIATVIGLILIAVLYVLWFRAIPSGSVTQAGALMVATILIVIIANKTFSTQYIIWLSGPVAALLTIPRSGPSRTPRRSAILASTWILPLTVLTQLVYPTNYPTIVTYGTDTVMSTLILATRNAGLVAFTAWFVVAVVRRFIRGPHSNQHKSGHRAKKLDHKQ